MPKIEVIHPETGEHLEVEKIHYYRQLRKRGYLLPEEFNNEPVELQVVEQEAPKRGRGRPRKDS